MTRDVSDGAVLLGETSAGADAVIQAARRLSADLRARAPEAEALRRVPEANLAAIRELELDRLLLPAKHGGLETSWSTFASVTCELARGCTATAWCTGLLNLHHWMVGALPTPAQEAVWRDGARSSWVASALAPSGRATRVDDTFRLTGEWGWSSGIDHSDWVLLGGVVKGELSGVRLFLLHRSEFTIRDTWHVSAMRGTGSKSVVVSDAAVAENRTILLSALRDNEAPVGTSRPKQFQIPLAAVAASPLVSAALGTALAGIEDWNLRYRARTAKVRPEELSRHRATHAKFAESVLDIEVAQAMLSRNAAALDSWHRASPSRAHVRARWDYVTKLCARATSRLFESAGASVIHDAVPLQRAWRDVHAIANHIGLNFEASGDNYGRELLGFERNPFEQFY